MLAVSSAIVVVLVLTVRHDLRRHRTRMTRPKAFANRS